MKGAHLVEDNIHTRTWSFDSIDCMYEHAMHKFLESYRQPVHGFPCARLKSLLLHLMWKVVWHLCGRRIVIPFILFISGTWKILRRLTITHCIRGINVGFVWWITELSLYTHRLKTGRQWVLVVWHHPSLSSSIWLSNGSNTWTSSSKVVVFILSTMCEIIVTNK